MVLPPWEVKRELIVKAEDETDASYGCAPEKRDIRDHIKHGLVNLDKPSGPTSHEVVAWVKRILNIDHAGHGGTLDPKVTGVLPVALEEATNVVGVFLLSGKEYVCVMRLHGEASDERVRRVLEEFVGKIYQKPPIRSSVRRSTRIRLIYYIEDLEFMEKRVLFRVGCQSGTYIRKLCHDIGEALGVGAHMGELRRTRTGPFIEDEGLITLYDLKGAYDLWAEEEDESWLREVVQPMEMAFKYVPKIYIRDSAVDSICHGAKLAVPGISKLCTGIKRGFTVGFFSLKGELVAMGRAKMSTEEILNKTHGIAADTTRVVMSRGTYPKMWQSQGKGTSSSSGK
jgi:H/ACA ribonucleoprotein complex subunit 4